MARQAVKKSVRFEIFKRDQFTCQYCGEKAPDVVLEIDHITPVADGGDNDLLNLITACRACNAGKSDKALADTVAIDKRRSQLEDLEDRRQQLEMMHEWHLSLVDLDDQAATMAGEIWFKCVEREGRSLTDKAKDELRRLIKRHGFDGVCVAIKSAVEAAKRSSKDYEEACNEWFWKIGRIITTEKMEQKEPGLKDLLYIRGILRNRCSYINEWACLDLLKEARDAGACVKWMTDYAKQVSSWSQFRSTIETALQNWQQEETEATDGTNP